ncbi:aminopeptidase N [Nocardioides sp. R-C-SC26]|uniref:aminopeptidase N n=1 Tax=Nocardioides sp. R-C-SC26 TaxID=2870414 RepID=UPI001E357DB0|nr:aminopeptidase N [Nocardioides sp. R-C-SC26]
MSALASSSSVSLLRSEAEARAAQLTVAGYEIDLDLDAGEETFSSRTVIRFDSTGGASFVDVKPAQLLSVRLNGTPIDTDTLERGRIRIATASGANELEVEATMAYRHDGEGLHRSIDPADGHHYVYGMSFMDAAPSVFACFDQPDLKAPYTFTVRAPRDWTVIGNSPAEKGDDESWRWGPTQPLSTYFVTLVAGPYHLIRSAHDGIPLGLSCRASLAPHLEQDAEEILTLTGQCFDEFHRLFGIRYPFGDYHQAFVPEFNAGAMENPGCVTFRDQLVFDSRVTRGQRLLRATTIAHEMAHQWFGNLTTPRWWDDLWLNESFAEYLGNRVTAEVTEFGDAWEHVAWSRRQWGLSADQAPSTHPVAGNGAGDALTALQSFDGISYAKGSSILKQIATSIGDEAFFGGAIDLFERHRFGNATMDDLFACWRGRGAEGLDDVIAHWLLRAGADVISLDRQAGRLVRTAPVEPGRVPADRRHRLQLARLRAGEATVAPVELAGVAAPVAVAPDDVVVIDPYEQSWGVYVPDAITVRGLVSELPRVVDPTLRAAIWNNLKSGYSVAQVAPDDIVEVLVADLPVYDTEDTARHTMPWVLSEVLPAAADGSTARVHTAARGLAESLRPGSETQLAAFRAAVHTAVDPDLLRAWLTQPPAGVEADLAVRWRVLVRLATLGAVTPEELDAALADEPTAVSRVEHTRARASLPTEEAKEYAWSRFTGAVQVANYELEAAGLGMWRGGQSEVLGDYVARYVRDLPHTSNVRSGWVLALAAAQFFPTTIVDDATLAAVRTLLEPGVLEPAVHRRVVDRIDQFERQLAVRRAYPRRVARDG